MPDREWLSLAEIAWLWSDETGESAEAIERDLEDWFEDFVAREPAPQPGSPGRDGDTTNLLMGLLGGRHLQRETLAVYCAERGRDMPLFWFVDESEDADDVAPGAGPPTDLLAPATYQGLAEDDVEAGPMPRAPWTHPGPAGSPAARPGPLPLPQAVGETLANVTARLHARVPPLSQIGRSSHPKATWLAGGLALALLLLVVGPMLGQGGTGRPEAGREETGRPETGREDASAAAAGDPSRQRLILAVEIARTQAALRSRDLAAALDRLARLDSEAQAAKADAASLAVQLAEMRRLWPDAPQATTADSHVARQERGLAAQTAAVHAARLGQDLDAARRRISRLEADAGGLAAQLAEVRDAHAATLAGIRSEAAARERQLAAALDRIAELESAQRLPDAKAGRPAPRPVATPNDPETAVGAAAAAAPVATRPTRPEPSAVAEPIDVDSLVTDPARYDAHHVVVTGSLLRLLQHYRLQSNSGLRTLVVDVAGIHRAEYDELQHAIAGAGVIGSVRARISGKVERGSADAFRLVASELKLVE